jgi:hypothetical protein
MTVTKRNSKDSTDARSQHRNLLYDVAVKLADVSDLFAQVVDELSMRT